MKAQISGHFSVGSNVGGPCHYSSMRTTRDVRIAGHPAGTVHTRKGVDGTTGGIAGDLPVEVSGPPSEIAGLPDDVLLATLDAAFTRRRRIEAEIVALAGEVGARSTASLGTGGLASRVGETSPAAVIATVGRVGMGDARRLCRLGDATRTRTSLVGEVLPPLFPAVAEAMTAGVIGVESATHIVSALMQAAPRAVPADLVVAEEALAVFAGTHPTDMVRALATRCRDALDTDGVQPREAELVAGRCLRRMLLPNGLKRFHLDLDPLSAAHLDASIDAAISTAIRRVRFTDTSPVHPSTSDATEDDLPDPRTLGQIGADAVVDLARHSNGCSTIGVPTPSVTIVVRMTLDSLLSGLGAATIDGCEQPITATTARHLAADAHLIPLVLGGEGEVLDLGRSRRLFTRAQRLALTERDGGCAFPTCDRPPTWTEAHHIDWWSRGGPTDLDNGVLLCTRHHHTVHAQGWDIEIRDTIPWFIPPHTIDPSEHSAAADDHHHCSPTPDSRPAHAVTR